MANRNTRITGSQILDLTITAEEIANDTITGTKLADAVAGAGLSKDGSENLEVDVDDSTIEINGATGLQVKDGGITSAKIATNGVTATNLADNAVDTNAIVDAAVTSAKIATNGVTATNLADNAVDTDAIQADAVDGSKIADDSISDEHLDAVDSPSDGEVLSWSTATNQFEWITQTTATGITEGEVVNNEVPTGDINGINTYYVIANTPIAAGIQLFLNGILQEPAGGDYTLSATGITFDAAPETGDELLACYIKLA